MLLTNRQKDALIKFMNIALDRSAVSLSELVGVRVRLELPEVYLHPASGLATHLSGFADSDIATVSQIFKGSMSGNALWLLNYNSAVKLMNLLSDCPDLDGKPPDVSAYEMLTEVGNILLNACLGMLGNLLDMKVFFSMPLLNLQKLNVLLNSLVAGKNELRYSLTVKTTLHLYEHSVSGYISVVLGVPSLYQLIKAIETWADLSVPNQPAQSISFNS